MHKEAHRFVWGGGSGARETSGLRLEICRSQDVLCSVFRIQPALLPSVVSKIHIIFFDQTRAEPLANSFQMRLGPTGEVTDVYTLKQVVEVYAQRLADAEPHWSYALALCIRFSSTIPMSMPISNRAARMRCVKQSQSWRLVQVPLYALWTMDQRHWSLKLLRLSPTDVRARCYPPLSAPSLTRKAPVRVSST
jgi:hypothetical protein